MVKHAGRKRGANGSSKSQAIRDSLAVLGVDSAPKDVIADLKLKKITVSPAHVSNVKAELRQKGLGSGTSRRGAKAGIVSVASLMEAKRFSDMAGGVEQAKRVLETLAQLR